MSFAEGVYNLFQDRYSIANLPELMFNGDMRLFKEPLLHFVVIGALFFGIYALVNRPARTEGIMISDADIQQWETQFSNDWNRVPTAEEREEMIRDYIREELAVREGLAQGLDQNDPVVRQRIRQKLELLVEEEAVVAEPTDQELENYLQENADLFRDKNGNLPKLNEIRNLVIFEWENTQRIQELDQFYKTLESKYGVRTE